jgi:hypothetical protein
METTANFHLLRPRFFARFNFIWLGVAFVIGISLCYPDNLKGLWISLPRFARWMAVILLLVASGVTLYLVLPLLLYFDHPTGIPTNSLQVKWYELLRTLSGQGVAWFIFRGRRRDNFICSFLVDCCRRIYGVGHLVYANVTR